ncbi:putative Ig domain-containing protein [Brevibacillus marinus]|uniref:putative Ig domain-containing protein n=1 Tax=Brevibacillus marinus TaxID=2496837 RepID=UPI000F8209C5|nr:putative Ig domain-containing protein [Brevibacillus marinus]
MRRNIFLLLLVFFLVCSLVPARVTATVETLSHHPREELGFFDTRLSATEEGTPSNVKKSWLGSWTRMRDIFHWLSSGNPMLWYRLVLLGCLDFAPYAGGEFGNDSNAVPDSTSSGGSGGSGGGSKRDDSDDDRVPAFWIVPDYAEVVAGESVAFQAKMAGRDSWPSDFPLVWSASGGRIDQQGRFTADEPGTYTVKAKVLGKSASAQVRVAANPVASIRVVPDDAEILVGETVQFQAELTGTDGQPLTDVPVEWSASSGRIDQQGRFTADEPGTYTVTAAALGKSASAQVTVMPLPEVESISLLPPSAVMYVGNVVTFQAVLVGTDGQPLTDVPVEWSASGGRIDQQGTFTADQPGTYTVTAAALGKSASAQVTVIRYQPAPPPAFKLKPLPDLQNGEGDAVSFTVALTNPAFKDVEFSMQGAPKGVQIDPATGEVSGTIAYDNVDEPAEMMKAFHVVVTATETAGLKRVATEEFTWTIGPEFKLKALPDRQSGEGDSVFSRAELTNPNIISVQFSMQGAPNGVQIDPYTGEVFGTIDYDNVDELSEAIKAFHVVVTATETGGLKRVVTEEFTWVIGPEFKLKALPDRYNNEGDLINFKVELTNPNIQFVEFSIERAPMGVQIDPETGEVSGMIDFATVGDPNLRLIEFNVVVRATETAGLKRVTEVTFHWVIYDSSES